MLFFFLLKAARSAFSLYLFPSESLNVFCIFPAYFNYCKFYHSVFFAASSLLMSISKNGCNKVLFFFHFLFTTFYLKSNPYLLKITFSYFLSVFLTDFLSTAFSNIFCFFLSFFAWYYVRIIHLENRTPSSPASKTASVNEQVCESVCNVCSVSLNVDRKQ